jgi:hypothetical protein
MGLDMYAYVGRKGQLDEYYNGAEWDAESKDTVNPTVTKPREIAYWRKHPNLHGWMKQLWHSKNEPGLQSRDQTFNGIELELTWQDIEDLERAIQHRQLPETTGFFFGSDADDHYYESDLAFVKAAKAELFLGLQVFYNSSW